MPRFLIFVRCLGLSLAMSLAVSPSVTLAQAKTASDCTGLSQNLAAYRTCMNSAAQAHNPLHGSASELHFPAANVTRTPTAAETAAAEAAAAILRQQRGQGGRQGGAVTNHNTTDTPAGNGETGRLAGTLYQWASQTATGASEVSPPRKHPLPGPTTNGVGQEQRTAQQGTGNAGGKSPGRETNVPDKPPIHHIVPYQTAANDAPAQPVGVNTDTIDPAPVGPAVDPPHVVDTPSGSWISSHWPLVAGCSAAVLAILGLLGRLTGGKDGNEGVDVDGVHGNNSSDSSLHEVHTWHVAMQPDHTWQSRCRVTPHTACPPVTVRIQLSPWTAATVMRPKNARGVQHG